MALVPKAPTAPETNALPLPKLPVYTLAGLPDATKNANALVVVTNGNAGASCLAVSDSVNWFPIAVGTSACS